MTPSTHRLWRHWGIAAAVLALGGLTLWFRLEMTLGTLVDAPVRADAAEYYAAAWNLKHFGIMSITFPDGSSQPPAPAARTPGYPVFILPFVEYPPTLQMLAHIVTAQAILGMFTVLLIFAVLKRLMPGPYAFAAALLAAISPHLVAADVYVLTESLYAFCIALIAWTLAGLAHRPGAAWALAAGAAIGLSALVRETSTYLAFFLCLGLFLIFPRRAAWRLSAFLVLGFALIFGPWYARNHLNRNIAPEPGLALGSILGGTYPGLMYNQNPQSRGMPHRFDPHHAQINTWGKVAAAVRGRYAQDPARYIRWYLIGKPTMLLSWDMIGGWGDVYVYPVIRSPYFTDPWFKTSHRFMQLLHWPLMVLALAGCLLVWMPSARTTLAPSVLALGRLVSLMLIYMILLHSVATPLPRYATPFRPLLFGMALFAVWTIIEILRTGHWADQASSLEAAPDNP